jgi:hypothetical protein
MKKFLFAAAMIWFTVAGVFAQLQKVSVVSPDKSVQIQIEQSVAGELTYQVLKNKKVVIGKSDLGLNGDVNFDQGLQIVSTEPTGLISETYSAPAEKRHLRTFTANGARILVKNKAAQKLSIDVRISNEGAAFRYQYQSDSQVAVKSEKTSFQFLPGTRAWLHPHADAHTGWAETQPSYEEQYEYAIPVGTPSPQKAGWSFPALFNSGNHWILITEAGLTPDYVGTRLAQTSEGGKYTIGFPQMLETVDATDPNYVVSKNIVSPWRVIVVGSLAEVVESQMVSDLAMPADPKRDFSWVKTGISSWSWGVLHDDATVYPVQKEFIDYASRMQWEYCLIDADWDWKIGYDKIKELADYGKTKNVKVLLWYNSSGSWNSTKYTPKNALLEREARRKEFFRIAEMGVAGVKVDFWPGDGQSTIQYYYDMLADAADAKLLVNFHGTTVPRGWSRTFPNLVAMESIRGFEFTTFEQKDTDLAPKHLTMMPYARNVVGPMDFTPVCFTEIKGKKRRTSNAFELALSVVLQAGVQHYVEIPESMAKQPENVQSFLKTIPRQWDDIKLLAGFPGESVVIARKAGNKWYIGGINSTSEVKKITINLKALKSKAKTITVITDGSNNRSFDTQKKSLKKQVLEIELQPNGGFVTTL